MSDLDEINLLIDKAAAVAGSDAKLARLVGQVPQVLSQMRHGRRAATPEDCALFAAVAGLDPMQEAARAMLRKHDGSRKGELLLKALGKASLVTGAAVASAGAHAGTVVSWISGWMPSSLSEAVAGLMLCVDGKRKGQRFALA